MRKMVVDERLKAEIVQEARTKSGEASSSQRDSQTSCARERHLHQGGILGLPSD